MILKIIQLTGANTKPHNAVFLLKMWSPGLDHLILYFDVILQGWSDLLWPWVDFDKNGIMDYLDYLLRLTQFIQNSSGIIEIIVNLFNWNKKNHTHSSSNDHVPHHIISLWSCRNVHFFAEDDPMYESKLTKDEIRYGNGYFVTGCIKH